MYPIFYNIHVDKNLIYNSKEWCLRIPTEIAVRFGKFWTHPSMSVSALSSSEELKAWASTPFLAFQSSVCRYGVNFKAVSCHYAARREITSHPGGGQLNRCGKLVLAIEHDGDWLLDKYHVMVGELGPLIFDNVLHSVRMAFVDNTSVCMASDINDWNDIHCLPLLTYCRARTIVQTKISDSARVQLYWRMITDCNTLILWRLKGIMLRLADVLESLVGPNLAQFQEACGDREILSEAWSQYTPKFVTGLTILPILSWVLSVFKKSGGQGQPFSARFDAMRGRIHFST